MNKGIPWTSRWRSKPAMHIFGIIILAGFVLYYGFLAADALGLATQTGTAKVTGKGFRKAGRTYYTQYIEGRPLVMPQAIPEMYLLKIEIGGRETECAVAQSVHEAVKINDRVQVTYQRRRLTHALRVLDVRP